ncbi:MAG: protein kinase [Planctomycetota bacterium]
MDDQTFGRYLIARGLVPRERLEALLISLPPGARLAELLVAEGLLTPDGARRAWAAASAVASPPRGDTTRALPVPDLPGPDLQGPDSAAPDAPERGRATGETTRVDAAPLAAERRGADTTRVGPVDGGPAADLDTAWDPRASDAAGAAAASAAGGALPREGEVLDGRYRIEGLLGRGGMGAVFRAVDLQRGAPVALKVLLPALTGPELLQRFEREAQLAARVDRHEGVVRVHAFGRHHGAPYCVMELLEGEELGALIRAGLPCERAARILARAARTLAACHEHGVVHRDVKPANLLVLAGDQPKLLDFGLARDDTVERLTRTGELLGTPSYMAPEQVDRAHTADARADVYSLGAVLYLALTGRAPFEGAVAQVLREVLLEDPPPPRSLRPEAPPALEAVCLKAMAKDPAARYQSAAELADELERALAGQEVAAQAEAGAWARFRARYRRGEPRAVLAMRAAAALALLLALGALAARYLGVRARSRAAWEQHHAVWHERLERYALGQGEGELTPAELAVADARLAALPAWSVSPETAAAVAAERARLAAHRRLLAARAGQDPGPAGEGPTARVVEGLLLRDRSYAALRAHDRAAARRLQREALELLAPEGLEGADRAVARGVQVELELGPRLERALEGAPTARDVEALRRELLAVAERARELAVDAAALSELKRRALQRVHELWRGCFAEVERQIAQRRGDQSVPALLTRLEVALRTPPAVTAAQAGILPDLAGLVARGVENLEQAHRAGPDSALYAASLEALIALDQGIFYRVDQAHQAPLPLALAIESDHAGNQRGTRDLEFMLITIRVTPRGRLTPSIPSMCQTAYQAAGVQSVGDGAVWRWAIERMEALEQARPGSRAARLVRLLAARELDLHKSSPDSAQALDALAREVVEGGPGLIDDLGPPYLAYARAVWAKGLNVLAALVPARARQAYRKALEVVLPARADIPPQYASDIYSEGGMALNGLEAPAEERLRWWEDASAYYEGRLAGSQQDVIFVSDWRLNVAKALRNRALLLIRDLDRSEEGEALALRGAGIAAEVTKLKRRDELYYCLAVAAEGLARRQRYDEAEAVLARAGEEGVASLDFACWWIEVPLRAGRLGEARRRLELVQRDPRAAQRDEVRRLAERLERRERGQ